MQARPRWTFGQFALLFMWWIIGAMVGGAIVVIRIIDVDAIAAGNPPDLTALSTADVAILLLAQSTGAAGYLLYLSVRHGTANWANDFGLRLVPFRLSGIFIGLGLQILVVAITAALTPLGQATQAVTQELVDAHTVASQILIGFLIVVLAPIIEEIMFRGVLLSRLYLSLPAAAAVMISALAFAAIHLGDANAWALPGLVTAGIVLGWFTIRDRDLSRAVPIHMGFNLTAVVALFALPM